MRSVWITAALVAAAAAALVVTSVGVASSAGSGNAYAQGPPKYCGMKTGPSYQQGVAKSMYTVSVRKVSCSFAIGWMRKLAGKPLKKDTGTISGGPAGYRCIGFLHAGLPKQALDGWCRKGELQFYWKPPGGGTG